MPLAEHRLRVLLFAGLVVAVVLALAVVLWPRAEEAGANPLPSFTAIAAGELHTCALTTGGGAKCWGDNTYLQLGQEIPIGRLAPVDVPGLASGGSAITSEGVHSCIVTTVGGAKCWGWNLEGQLGDGTNTSYRLMPVDALGLTGGVAAAGPGGRHTCALSTSGGVKCWGQGGYGQLGTGVNSSSLTPVDVLGLTSGVAAIASGQGHSCALTSAGGVKCWGLNDHGQLGDGTGTDRPSPVDVVGLSSGVTAIAAGFRHTCAAITGGGVQCWGDNGSRQVTNVAVAQYYSPVAVGGLSSGAVSVAGGGSHTCALMTSGGVKCWGSDASGQLGNGAATGPAVTDVLGLTSGVAAVAAGGAHTCALTNAGGVKCWGRNGQGQLGDGTTTNRLAPVDPVALKPAPMVSPCAPGLCEEMSLRVTSPEGVCDSAEDPTKCSLPAGSQFALSVFAKNPPPVAYRVFTTESFFGSLAYKPSPTVDPEIVWPLTGSEQRALLGAAAFHAAIAVSPTAYTGEVIRLGVTCPAQPSSSVIYLPPYHPTYNAVGSAYGDAEVTAAGDFVIVNCTNSATFTPGPSRTPTRTNTPPPTPSGQPAMSLDVPGADCDAPTEPTKCTVVAGSPFDLAVTVKNYPLDPDGPAGPNVAGYTSVSTDVDWTGSYLVYEERPNSVEVPWPNRGYIINANLPLSPTRIGHGDLSSGGGTVPSTFKGIVVSLRFTCTAGATSNVITLVAHDAVTNPGGSALTDHPASIFPTSDTLTINCIAASAPTPTATPNPIPRMQKLPVLQNLFLTRQGAKIPPATCLTASNVAVLTESINIPISGQDPKDPSQPRQLGGFSFQVKYDQSKVCVTLRPGPVWTANPQQVCTIEDSATAPALQGIARINCVTLGKATVVDTSSAAGRTLALIEVRPQPEAYSQIRPNQDNGQAVQINNELCKLTDLQGHVIPVFSCEDADVTIRFLEGDVEPDCAVNTLDTQAVAFRWGAQKGGLVYNERFNLEPSGTQADQDIDVNDLQFVYGRFASTCAAPWPAQPPVNPKA